MSHHLRPHASAMAIAITVSSCAPFAAAVVPSGRRHKRLALFQQPRAVEQVRRRRQHPHQVPQHHRTRGRRSSATPPALSRDNAAHPRAPSKGTPAPHGRDCSVPPPPVPCCTVEPASPRAPPFPPESDVPAVPRTACRWPGQSLARTSSRLPTRLPPDPLR